MSHESDFKLEQKLQELQAKAPRLTPQHIYSLIVKETFTRLPSQKKLTCELTLKNGYSVTGESSVISPENYRQEIGEQISRERATAAIWPLEGYLLQQRLYEAALQVTDSAGRVVEFVRDSMPPTKQPILKADASTKRVIELARMVLKMGDVPDVGVSDEVIDFLDELSEFSTAVLRAKKVIDSENTPVGYMSADEMKALFRNATSVITPPSMVDGEQQIPVFVKPQEFVVPEGWRLVPTGHPHLHFWIAAFIDSQKLFTSDQSNWNETAQLICSVLTAAPDYEKEMKK